MAWDRLAVEKELKKEIRTALRMIALLGARSDDEIMAAALPNFSIWAYEYRNRVIEEWRNEQ